jgi:hypothetical protein
MRSFTVSLLGLALVTATLCACSGGGSSNVPAPVSLTPAQRNANGVAQPSVPLSALGKTIESNQDVAAISPATSVIKVSPSSVTLITSGQTQTLNISEPGYSGSFTVTSSNPAIATVSPVVSGQATVTAVAQGSTYLAVSDQLKHKVTVPVTVGLAQLVLEQFRSPSTQSIAINANGQTAYVNLASAPSGCTNFSVSCSVTAPEIVGANTFRLSTYDGQNGAGNLLSTGAVSAQITSPSSVQRFSVPLGGAVSALTIALGNPTPPPGTPTTSSVNLAAFDADRNAISGTGSYVTSSGAPLSVTIADSDRSGATSVKPKTVSKPSTIPVLSYTGAPLPSNATITASAPGGISPVQALFAPGESFAGEIYVANWIQSVLVFPVNPSGTLNETPLATIAGANTDLDYAAGVAVNASGKIYVTNDVYLYTFGYITVYAANPFGTLNEAPVATISGSNTGLVAPAEIAVDASGKIYVADGNSIYVYAANPSGTLNEAPLATITGSNTGLGGFLGITGLALDASGKIYVSSNSGSAFPSILVFPANPSGTLNEAPIATISGSNTELGFVGGLAVDATGRIYTVNSSCGNCSSNNILVFPANPSGTLNEAPLATIIGSNTGLNNPEGIAVDVSGKIYVTNTSDKSGNGNGTSITVYGPNPSGTLNEAPLATIAGSNTGLKIPFGIAVH